MWKNGRKRSISLICRDFVLRMKLHEKSKTKQDQLVPATLSRLPWGRNCHFFLCSWYQSSWSIVSKEAQSYWLGLMASPRQPRRCWVLCAAWPFPGAELFLSRPQEEPWAHQELWGSQFVVPRFQPKPAPFRWLVVVKKQQQWGRLRIKGEKWD